MLLYTNEIRLNYLKDFPKFDKYILVFMKKDKTELEYFNKKRPKYRWVPEESLRELYKRFEDINDEVRKSYDEVIEINDYL